MSGAETKYAFVPDGGETFRVAFTLDYSMQPPRLAVQGIARGLTDASDLSADRRAGIASWLAHQIQAVA